MYKFLVFAGANYYPKGPEDFQKAFKSFEKAKAFQDQCLAKNETTGRSKFDWAAVWSFDAETGAFAQDERSWNS